MKNALVTGASSGIGRAFAIRLANDGFSVTAVARNEAKLKELISQLGAKHSYVVADLSTLEGLERIQAALGEKKYALLINNAGVGTQGKFTDIPFEKQMSMLQLNNHALVGLSYTFLKTARLGDALVNVSSALAFMPTPSMALYCATKAFVTSLSESLWYEYKSKGIYVLGLCPGITETEFQVTAGGRKEDLPKNLSQTPEFVVNIAMEALNVRQKPTVLTSFKNHMFAGMSRMLPRKAIVAVTGKMMPS